MSVAHPVGLSDLLDAWRKLRGTYDVEEVAKALRLAVLPEQEPPPDGDETPDAPPVFPDEDEPWSDPDPHRGLEPSSVEFEVSHEPAGEQADSERVEIVADPLSPDKPQREMPRRSLFAPRLVRDLIRRTLSTSVVSRDIDTDRLVELISRGAPLRRIPRGSRLSLRRGVQVLRDIGESMEPYIEDQLQLMTSIRNLVGEHSVEELRSTGVPGPCWSRHGRITYTPPTDGRPVLVLSDAGIGRPPDVDECSGRHEWDAFLGKLSRLGAPVVLYLPYRKFRWPPTLRKFANVNQWDRPELPKKTKLEHLAPAIFPEEKTAYRVLQAIQKRLPGVIDLARSLALAARVEPTLLRRARLELVPWVGAGGEADLLFSNLVESRSSECFVFFAAAQRLLQRQLANSPAQLKAVAEFLADFRDEQQAPESIRLEENVNRLYCEAWANKTAGSDVDSRDMESAVAPALASLRSGRAAGLANWALRAAPRFPPELRGSATVQSLRMTAGKQVGAKAILADVLDESPERIRAVLPTDLSIVPVGVRWTEQGLTFMDPYMEGDEKIMLPDTHPRAFWLEPPESDEPGKRYLLEPRGSVLVPADELRSFRGPARPELRIRTLTGDKWLLRAEEADARSRMAASPGQGTTFSLEVVSAREGDCFLLHWGSPDDPRVILIDGGPAGTFNRILRPRLQELRVARSVDQIDPLPVELIILSHMDDPQSNGILYLLKKLLDDHTNLTRPDVRVKAFWYNETDKPDSDESDRKPRSRDLRKALRQLSIPVNSGLESGLAVASGGVDLPGGLRAEIIWPLKDRRSGSGSSGLVDTPRRSDRSPANLASLVVLLTWAGKEMLFTGDARGDHIVEGLANAGRIGPDAAPLHLDVLKIPHQGSDRNVTSKFFEIVTADHYVVTGNGKFDNPKLETFEMLFEARRRDSPFTIHFAHRPEDFKDSYPVKELQSLFARFRDKGWHFDVRVPAGGAYSLLIELGETGGLSSREARPGVSMQVPRAKAPEPSKEQGPPLLNREAFREILTEFSKPEPRTSVAIVRGPGGSGKSYSWEFVKQAARRANARPILIDLSSAGALEDDMGDLASELARKMGLKLKAFPKSDDAHRFVDLLVSRLAEEKLKEVYWVVVDGHDIARAPKIEAFSAYLAESVVDGRCPSLRLVLLGLEGGLSPSVEAAAFIETLSPLKTDDVREFFTGMGLQGDRLEEMVDLAVASETEPFDGNTLRRLNSRIASIVDSPALAAGATEAEREKATRKKAAREKKTKRKTRKKSARLAKTARKNTPEKAATTVKKKTAKKKARKKTKKASKKSRKKPEKRAGTTVRKKAAKKKTAKKSRTKAARKASRKVRKKRAKRAAATVRKKAAKKKTAKKSRTKTARRASKKVRKKPAKRAASTVRKRAAKKKTRKKTRKRTARKKRYK